MKKILITLLFAITATLASFSVVKAQEINPGPGTYSYGSSSESSGYLQLGRSNSTSGSLAPTGESIVLFAGLALVLIVSSVCTFVFVLKKHPLNS